MTKVLTQKRLKEVLHYNPETGIFTNLINRSSNAVKGMRAGTENNNGYREIYIDNKKYKEHRLAFLYMKNYFPKYVDHINHKTTDNKWSNLRKSTLSENQKNSSLNKNNTSGHIGIYWNKKANKWHAQLKSNNETIYLGLFRNKEDAIKARQEANIKYGFHENHGREISNG